MNHTFQGKVMTVPRTSAQLARAAADAERWLDELDPAQLNASGADASALRRLGGAVRASAQSQSEVAAAVEAARGAGHPWRQIAAVLGTSRQAAQEKYGPPATTAS